MKKALTILSLALLGQASAATITVWTHFGDSELAWLRAQAADFKAKTGNTVNIVSVPFGEMTDKFIQSAPKGQGPDLLTTQPHDRLGQLAAGLVAEVARGRPDQARHRVRLGELGLLGMHRRNDQRRENAGSDMEQASERLHGRPRWGRCGRDQATAHMEACRAAGVQIAGILQ